MTRIILVAAVLAALALAGCALFAPASSTVSSADIASFQKVYMSSYYAERGGTPAGAKGLTPFLKVAAGTGAKTTVNTGLLTDKHFASLSPLTFSNYPEPGQTTTFTVATKDAAHNVYDVIATTTYPSGDERSKYVEEYYVEDGNPTYGTAADGIWDTNDPVVKQSAGTWVQDQKARVQQVLTFTDGTTRAETIVAQTQDWGLSPSYAPRFASFDVNGSLDFSQAFYPAQSADSGHYVASGNFFSSVVIYSVTPGVNTNYWFWQGTQAKSILGIRYYTEYWDTTAKTFNSYTVSFEKTVDTLTTTGGGFTTTLASVFAGSQFSTLAESVLRQQVSYTLDSENNLDLSSGQKATRMQTRVADITGNKDFYLQQQNTDYVTLSDWTTTTIYTPTGNVAEVTAADPSKFAYSRTLAQPSGGIPLVVPTGTTDNTGTGDLATLYSALQNGAVTINTGSTIPGSIEPAGVEWSYSGSQGTSLASTPSYQPGPSGTVEAWIYINQQVDTAGVVHKGVRTDFADEAYSLQFWGNQGTMAFVLDTPGSAGSSYDLVTSTYNLNTAKWYYIVATWDTTTSPKYINLYINGTLNSTVTPTHAPNGADPANTSDVLIGSQLPAQYSAFYGYFGFNGKINGVRISSTATSAATVAANYATYVLQTPSW